MDYIYVIADNDYEGWAGVDKVWKLERPNNNYEIKKGHVYKGVAVYNGVKGKKHSWTQDMPPFREISKIEAFVLSRGEVEMLP